MQRYPFVFNFTEKAPFERRPFIMSGIVVYNTTEF